MDYSQDHGGQENIIFDGIIVIRTPSHAGDTVDGFFRFKNLQIILETRNRSSFTRRTREFGGCAGDVRGREVTGRLVQGVFVGQVRQGMWCTVNTRRKNVVVRTRIAVPMHLKVKKKKTILVIFFLKHYYYYYYYYCYYYYYYFFSYSNYH